MSVIAVNKEDVIVAISRHQNPQNYACTSLLGRRLEGGGAECIACGTSLAHILHGFIESINESILKEPFDIHIVQVK